MKRFHVNLNVSNLNQSIQFYSELFGHEPSVVKEDYAKWMLEDLRINFAINNRSKKIGVNHLGLQADNAEEFHQLEDQLNAAELKTFAEGKTSCCYAQSEKAWVMDPDGNSWETFHTYGEATTYNGETLEAELDNRPHGNCC